MKRVFLIRHGEIDYPRNQKGEPLIYGPRASLSRFGRKQLKELGIRLKYKKIEIVYSSPFPRAVESANILVKQFPKPIPVKVVNNLRDVDVGGFVGNKLTIREFARVTDGGDSYSHQIFKKQETLIDMCNRAIRVFGRIIKSEARSCLAIVSHGDFLSALIWMIENKNPTSNYREIKNYFYIAKGQALEYSIDENTRNIKRLRIITIPGVLKTVEKWRKLYN